MIKVDEKVILFIKFYFFDNSSKLYNFSKKKMKENKEMNIIIGSRNKMKEKIEINTAIGDSTFIIMKNNNTIMRVDNQSNIESKKFETLLFHIRKNKSSNYSLENPIPTKLSEDNSSSLDVKLWFILNSNKNNVISNNNNNILLEINKDYFLCINDIIKFANIKYIVASIKIDSNENGTNDNNDTIYDDEDSINPIYYINKNSGNILDISKPKEYYESLEYENDKNYSKNCIFCRKKECTKENPIIKFCDCNYFHYECLKNIMNKKPYFNYIENENSNVKNYIIKKFKCTKCNTIYPLKFNISGTNYNLININNPFKTNYLILESIENKIFYGNWKYIHIIKLGDDIIKIGRSSKKNDVIISEPSVSREHAILEYKKEKGLILIKNVSETFGSLVLIKKAVKINENKIQMQVGKICIETQIMKYGEFEKIKNKNSKDPLPKKD